MKTLLCAAAFLLPLCALGAQTCSIGIGTSIATFPCDAGAVVTPPPPPPPDPVPSGCAAQFAPPDTTWTPFLTTTLFPIPPTSTSGPMGKSIRFIADSSISTYGLVIRVIDESGGNIALPKDVVIDQCPHVFTPSSPGCGAFGGITGLNLNVLMDLSKGAPKASDCPLTAGSTYYINFRASDKASPVQAQFGVSARVYTQFGF